MSEAAPSRFRFRAFCKRTKTMLYDAQDMYDCLGMSNDLYSTDIRTDSFGGILEAQQEGLVVVMQSTGLADKNGKEIFEGDVISHEWSTVHKPQLRVVKWDDQWDFGLVGFQVPERQEHREVVGNIWENPEMGK